MKEQPNLSSIKELSGGDTDFESLLINIIKKELPEEIETYHNNLSSKNYQLAADNVHKLKHKISALGLEASYYLATDYENELRENNLSKKYDFEEVLEAMTNFVNKL